MASGSNTRKRQYQTIVRWTRGEWSEAIAKADALGLSLPAALRSSFLDTPEPATQKRTPAHNKKLSQLLGHCGKIGSNLNQIHRVLAGRGEPKNPRLEEARAAYPLIRSAIRAARDTAMPSGDKNILPSLLDHALRIGKDINETARLFNTGRQPEFEDALTECLTLRDAILTAFPQTQERPPRDHKG